MVQLSYDYLTEKGYNPYYLYKQKNTLGNLENVGFSKDGHESLYNIFIMEEIQTILAMGGGASTKMVKGDRIERVFNPKEAADYINRIDEIIEKKKKAVEFLKD
jgi:oxygen-independent coproporphyrinogen-3 oxidase